MIFTFLVVEQQKKKIHIRVPSLTLYRLRHYTLTYNCNASFLFIIFQMRNHKWYKWMFETQHCHKRTPTINNWNHSRNEDFIPNIVWCWTASNWRKTLLPMNNNKKKTRAPEHIKSNRNRVSMIFFIWKYSSHLIAYANVWNSMFAKEESTNVWFFSILYLANS